MGDKSAAEIIKEQKAKEQELQGQAFAMGGMTEEQKKTEAGKMTAEQIKAIKERFGSVGEGLGLSKEERAKSDKDIEEAMAKVPSKEGDTGEPLEFKAKKKK